MTLNSAIKTAARKLGVDISRYNPAQSPAARILTLLTNHNIDLVLDVGANDGGYARFLRAAGYQGRIISFEPLSDAHSKLLLAGRGDRDWRVAPRMALGSVEGEHEINVAGNSTSSSFLRLLDAHLEAAPNSGFVRKERVRVARLDRLDDPVIKGAGRIFLKIDTQGYEKPVLEGAEGIMRRVIGVQLEMSLTPLYEGQVSFRELLDLVIEKGFEMWGVFPGFINQGSGRLLQVDGVFFRKEHNIPFGSQRTGV